MVTPERKQREGMLIWEKVELILKSKWTKRLLMLLSLAGFLWQVIVVSINYFGYKTSTSVSFRLMNNVKPQISILCVRYHEVLMHDKMIKDPENKFLSRITPEESDNLTVAQIFKYTPEPDDAIKSCLVRDENGLVSSQYKTCGHHFNVTKYFTQEYICYRFQKKAKDEYSFDEITHSITKAYLVYEILLTDAFTNVSLAEAIVYMDDGGYPFLSRDYGHKHVINTGVRDPDQDENYLFLSASDIVIKSLEKPYDTACIDVGENTGYRCVQPCKQDLYKTIDRVPGSELLLYPYTRRPYSEADKQDPVMRAKVDEFENFCRKKCYFTWCLVSLSTTSAVTSFNPKAVFGFSVNTPKYPDLSSRSVPLTTFIEYFSFTMGCFGIWFGVSFLSLYPDDICVKKIRVSAT